MTATPAAPALFEIDPAKRRFTFISCFVALVATSFAFIIRVMLMDSWQVAFNLSETQKGEIFAAGLWPFGISIVLFSLVVDRIGYGKSMVVALLFHIVSAVLMIMSKGVGTAQGYWYLYSASILNGLAAGTVEAIINPVVATMYPKHKTKMLTTLHAGWPGGFVLGGLIMLAMGETFDWQIKAGVILVPTVLYGLLLIKCRFPVNERVAAGIPYRDMLKEAGAIGALIVVSMVMLEIGRVFELSTALVVGVILVVTLAYVAYTRSLGRWMYVFLLVVMIFLAITELSTDTWIKGLMGPAMEDLGLNAGLVLIYTATIMMILRFCIGPIVKVLKPLGVLLVGSLFAAAGLYFLGRAEGIMILLAATIYGTGQTFFWPVTLGLISERFPRGGALTLNAIAGVGMLAAGILGSNLLGNLQDTRIDATLTREHPQLAQRVIDPVEKSSVFSIFAGKYRSLDVVQKNAVDDKVALYNYPYNMAEAQAIAAMTESQGQAGRREVLDQLELARKLDAPTEAAALTEEQIAEAKATEQKVRDRAQRIFKSKDFRDKLREDKAYHNLVRNAFDHLEPKEPTQPGRDASEQVKLAYNVEKEAFLLAKKEYDTVGDTLTDRLNYLEKKGFLLDPEQYQQVAADKGVIDKASRDAKQNAMATIAILPLIMAGCYLFLIIYFRATGGYKAIELTASGERIEHEPTNDEFVSDAEDRPAE